MQKDILTKALLKSIRSIIEETKNLAVRNVNTIIVVAYFHIGQRIVEYDQKGSKRADYAHETIKILSEKLTEEFGKGYSMDNLEKFRKFYFTYSYRISESLIRKSSKPTKKKSESPIRILESHIDSFKKLFPLSWTHYFHLLKIDNSEERNFYEIESINNNWSVREMQRQYHSSLYERLALSKNKKQIKELAKKGQIIEKPSDALKSPYVLEFLGLKEDITYSESELETAIIDKLEHFLLELGKGFLFAGRQKRISLDSKHFYIDLVFYNRLIKCFCLCDLKIGELTHQDIGQMQMYVNYYDRKIKLPEENPTLGIILCKEGNKTVVEFTLPENNKTIFAKEYRLYLPSKEDLKKQLQ